MPYGNVRDPGQEQFLLLEREIADAQQAYYERWSTPDMAATLAANSITYPGASSPLMLGLAQGGIAAGNPVADQLVYDEISNRNSYGPVETPGEGWWNSIWNVANEAVVEPLKGTTRWMFGAWEGAWEMTTGGALPRTLQMAQNEGITLSEAWGHQDPYVLEALGGVIAGEHVNLGSGILPNSDVAPGVSEEVNERMMALEQMTEGLPAQERYVKRLEAAPGIWRQSIEANATAQAELGKPITQLSRADAEAVMFTVPGGAKTPWSPGRMVAANIFEPGTDPFHKVSGTLDFGAQIFLDPIEWVGIGWARHGRQGRKIWGEVRKLLGATDTYAPPGRVALGPNPPQLHGRVLVADNPRPARQTIDELRPQIALPAGSEAGHLEGAAIAGEAGEQIPWWLSGGQGRVDRVAAPIDPPDWFIDLHRSTRQGAQFPHGGKEPVWNRLEPGIYEADMPRLGGQKQQKLVIQRKGKGKNQYWEIVRGDNSRVGRMPDDPRFDTPQMQFKTLREAQEVAHAEVARFMDDDLRVSGMTADEFIGSGEDYYLRIDSNGDGPLDEIRGYNRRRNAADGGKSWRGASRRTRREPMTDVRGGEFAGPEVDVPADVVHPRSAGDSPSMILEDGKWVPNPDFKPKVEGGVSGIKVRVFGRKLDLREGVDVDKLPQRLQDALRHDGKLATEPHGSQVLQGFGTNRNLDKWDETLRWAENNGYGKIIWDDDDILIVDKFIGGNHTDPLGTIRYESRDIPIGGRQFDGAPSAPTVGEVDDFLDRVGNIADEMEAAYARGDIDTFQYDAFKAAQARGASTGVPKAMADEAAERGRQLELMLNDVADDFDRLPDSVKADITNQKWADDAANVQRVEATEPPKYTFGPDEAVRPDWNPAYKLRGKRADLFLDRIVAATKAGGSTNRGLLDKLLSHIESRHIKVPNAVRRQLYEAKDRSSAEAIFVRWLTKEGPQEIILPGGARYGRLRHLGNEEGRLPHPRWIDSPAIQRRFAMSLTHHEFNMLDDPEQAYARFQDALPHYNIARGESVELLDDAGNPTGVFRNIEDVFDRIVQLDPDSTAKAEAFAIMQDFSEILFAKMAVDSNVDPRLARQVSRWWRETAGEAVYDAERFSMTNISDGVDEATIVKNALVGGLGPQHTAQLWNGALGNIPDPRTLKRVANYSDALGRIANDIALKKVNVVKGESVTEMVKLEERTLLRYYDNFITKVWKPFVLLRGAWTLRILMDDQFRMAAEGYSMFNHPMRIINYALSQSDDWATAFRKGYVDIKGVRFSTKNLDEMDHAKYLADAMMSRPDDIALGTGAYGRMQYDKAGKGSKEYSDGLAFEIENMQSSPVMKALADRDPDDAVDATVKWLMGDVSPKYRGGGSHERENIISMFSKQPETQAALRNNDEAVWRAVVERMNASLHRKTGGIVHYADGNGGIYDYAQRLVGRETSQEAAKGPRWIVESQGDTDLLTQIAVGRVRDDDTRKALIRRINRKVNAQTDAQRFPDRVIVPKPAEASGVTKSDYDKAIRTFYNFFMTKPSDALSRVPEFRRAYWDKISDLFPYMDDQLKAAVLAKSPPSEVRKALANARKTKGVEGQLEYSAQALDHIDELGKAHGLTMVEKTLFDLTNKRNISDSLRLVFPFVEAWGEFITRWGRLGVWGDRNLANARRFQQSIEGARENGFFYENDFGQEVFNYPAWITNAGIKLHNVVNDLPVVGDALGGDVSDEVAANIQTTGSVESLNFASGVIPGFGPIFQLGAKKFIPDDPQWDWVRDMVAPFGTEGGLAGTLSPAWVKRIMSAYGGAGDPQLEYTWTSTLVDVMKTKVDNGDFAGVTSQEEINALIKEAEEEAKGVMMVRAAATYFNPSSPSYKFQKEDKNGQVWSYSNLGREFYELAQEAGSDSEAWEEFYRRFGFLPGAFAGGKSYSILDRSLTEEGSRFERGQPDLFVQYPSTAMYLDPTIDGDSSYDHEAMLRQLRLGNRERWDAEQWVYLQQDQLGDLWWDNVNSNAMLIEDSDNRKAYLSDQRTQIEANYPYWRKPVPGKVQSVTNDEQMLEVSKWLADPALIGQPVVEAAREYEIARQEVLNHLIPMGASTIDGPKSSTTDTGRAATLGREWLRKRAEEIGMRVPQFNALFKSVYASEVGTYHDEPEPPELVLYDQDDILESVYG